MTDLTPATDVLFVTQNLDAGGSQRQLVVLARGLAANGHRIAIATFYSGGALSGELEGSGVRLVNLNKRGRWDLFGLFGELAATVKSLQPRIIHGFLDVPNLATLILRRFARHSMVVWGVRSAYVNWRQFDKTTQLSFRLGCTLARFADLAIFNSFAGREFHVERGYPANRAIVIQNGIDTSRFQPDPIARRAVRNELGIGAAEILIGIIGRMESLKGHLVFLAAARKLVDTDPPVRFVCIGGGDPGFKAELRKTASQLGLADRVIWCDERRDIARVYNALDICVSASEGEAFSNVIGESMSSGVPCIVTDTGDSALIVRDPEMVVPAGDADALAKALKSVMKRLGPSLAERCRQTILDHFSVDGLIQKTEAALGLTNHVGRLEPPRASKAG